MRRSMRRAKRKLVRTPGGRLVWHRVKHKKKIERCAICGKVLHGSRRNRKYGNLCADCARLIAKRMVIKYAQ